MRLASLNGNKSVTLGQSHRLKTSVFYYPQHGHNPLVFILQWSQHDKPLFSLIMHKFKNIVGNCTTVSAKWEMILKRIWPYPRIWNNVKIYWCHVTAGWLSFVLGRHNEGWQQRHDGPSYLDPLVLFTFLFDFREQALLGPKLCLLVCCTTSTSKLLLVSPDDDQSILIESSSCNLQFFFRTVQWEIFTWCHRKLSLLYLSSSPCKATRFTY